MIPAWIDRYLGLPYEQCDCWQLIRRVFAEQWGITLPTEPNPEGWFEVGPEEARLGDVLAFHEPRDPRHPWHVALCLGEGEILHADERVDTIRETYNRPAWRRRLAGAYRWPEPLTPRA